MLAIIVYTYIKNYVHMYIYFAFHIKKEVHDYIYLNVIIKREQREGLDRPVFKHFGNHCNPYFRHNVKRK